MPQVRLGVISGGRDILIVSSTAYTHTHPCTHTHTHTEYRAIHTFSSDKKGDLPFVEGDSVLVYWVHGSGWWYGSRGSMRGWFPGTHVEVGGMLQCTY